MKIVEKQHQVIAGVGASPGIAIGPAVVWKTTGYRRTADTPLSDMEIETEVGKFRSAVNRAIDDVESLISEARNDLTVTERDLLEMQVEMLADPQLHSDVVAQIRGHRQGVANALWEVSERIVRALTQLDSDYLSARTADIRACVEHIMRHLEGSPAPAFTHFPPGSVLVADDISPLQALTLDLKQVGGIVTRLGGSTSHAAILARARNIPAVVACGEELTCIAEGDVLIADGSGGQVWTKPSPDMLAEWGRRKLAFEETQLSLRSLVSQVAQTADGVVLRLQANISGPEDMKAAAQYGAEGAGLFRTELLFMNRSGFPSEEEQLESYKEVVINAQGYPVTIRTLDIGGDKPLSYFQIPREDNPFLGFRAIRISLDQVDLFQAQLRAILRASTFGPLRLMFPMICSLHELRAAKASLEEAKDQLRARDIPFNNDLAIGAMIETPSAAVIADLLAKEVDFFSIGTNDLCQYTLAVDRGNEKVNKLYDPFQPAVLRLIATTIEHAVKQNIEVSICGEMAADLLAAPLLVGMGLRSLSMSASSIPRVKRALLDVSLARAQELTATVMRMDDAAKIRQYLNHEVLNRQT